MMDDEYWSEGIKTMRKATKLEYEKQHCQDVTHALVLDMCWHVTSTVQRPWGNTMLVRIKINVACVNV